MELISGISPSLCHGTLPLALLAAASIDFLWRLKQCFPQNNGPAYSSSPNVVINFLQQLG